LLASPWQGDGKVFLSNSPIIAKPIPIVTFRVFCYCRTFSTAKVPKPLYKGEA